MPQVVIQHRVEKNKRIILTEAKVDDLKVYYIPEFPFNVPSYPKQTQIGMIKHPVWCFDPMSSLCQQM